MLSPERYSTNFLEKYKRKEKITAIVNRVTTSSIEHFFGSSKTLIFRFVFTGRTSLRKYISILTDKMVLAYGAYRLNYLKMESELSKKLEKNVGRIKTPHIYIEKGA